MVLAHPLYCPICILLYVCRAESNIYVFRAEFRDPFNTLTSGSIHTDPVDRVLFYVSKIWALIEKQIREAGVVTA